MEKLVAVIGPTAVGKTQVSIELARHLQSDVISGDSMLVYRGLDIGTAKPSLDERSGVVHHMIDIIDPDEEFTVVDFQQRAAVLISTLNEQGQLPVLAGGTGLYVKALLEGYQFDPSPGNTETRQKLQSLAEHHGNQYVYDMLRSVQPETAARLHPNNLRRVIRALEVYYEEGRSLQPAKAGSEASLMYDAAVIGLTMPRPLLYERINRRVDLMFSAGLYEEVQSLIRQGVSPASQSMQAIGYKEILSCIEGKDTLENAAAAIKQATRNFAKRQLTWYRRMPYIHWVDVSSYRDIHELMSYIYSYLAGKFQLR